MFIGHLPASYLVTRTLRKEASAALLLWGAAGSLFPDLDLIYFYLVDERAHVHHSYWTHVPFYWVCLLPLFALSRYTTMFWVNVMVHLMLDTVAGGVRWLAPLVPAEWVLFPVPARYDWWVANFLLHWTFGLELVVVGGAFLLWRKGRGRRRTGRRRLGQLPADAELAS